MVYHHIVPEKNGRWENNSAAISLHDFKEQMLYLKDNGYNTVTLQQMNDYIAGKGVLPDKPVLITFDDGYESNYVYALPILKDQGMHAVIFVIGSLVRELPAANTNEATEKKVSFFSKVKTENKKEEKKGITAEEEKVFELQNYNPAALYFLTWDEIREMSDNGVFEFASHTWMLHDMPDSNIRPYSVAAPEKINMDMEQLEQAFFERGIPFTKMIAYPHGYCNKKVLSIMRMRGYLAGFTTRPGVIVPGNNAYYLNRYTVSPGIHIDEFSSMVRRN